MLRPLPLPFLGPVLAAAALASCGPSETEFPIGNDNAKQTGDAYTEIVDAKGSLLAPDGVGVRVNPGGLFGGPEPEADGALPAAGPGDPIQVNGHLWSAALDTLSFMPLDHADPDGGIIQTGWFSDRDFPDERFRFNVFVLSGALHPDAVRVAVFHEIRLGEERWTQTPAPEDAGPRLEGKIVERARALAQLGGGD